MSTDWKDKRRAEDRSLALPGLGGGAADHTQLCSTLQDSGGAQPQKGGSSRLWPSPWMARPAVPPLTLFLRLSSQREGPITTVTC